jgi:hypothetical protein
MLAAMLSSPTGPPSKRVDQGFEELKITVEAQRSTSSIATRGWQRPATVPLPFTSA